MFRRILLTLVALVGLFAAWAAAAQRQVPLALACLHDAEATPANRARRTDALTLVRAINAAQSRAVDQTQQYQPIAALAGLPAAPEGFALRLYTDGAGYILSIKDTRDPCHYGVFSDERGRLYEASPQVPQLAS